MSILEGAKSYHDLAGLRGVLSISALRLFGFPKEIVARSPALSAPVRLRMRTTDLDVYREVIRGQYDLDLPFRPKVIVDAGANIGVTSIYFATKYPQTRIVAIEPERSNFEVLARNVRRYPSIIPVHAALWSRDGEIAVSNRNSSTGAGECWAFVTKEGGDGARVRAVTLATLMSELKIAAVDLVKIDIEGAEQEMFEDVGWLESVKCVVIELHDAFRPGCSAIVESALRGFDRRRRGETTIFLRPDVGNGLRGDMTD